MFSTLTLVQIANINRLALLFSYRHIKVSQISLPQVIGNI